MEVNQRVYYKNFNNMDIVTIINKEEKWTSFPHGSGTTYYVYTLKKDSGETIEYNTFDSDYHNYGLVTIGKLKGDNEYIKEQIKKLQDEITFNNKLIENLGTSNL